MILKAVYWLRGKDEYEQGERIRNVLICIICIVGLLICSDGKASIDTNWYNEEFVLKISQDGELHCINANTNQRVHLKNCPEIF